MLKLEWKQEAYGPCEDETQTDKNSCEVLNESTTLR